MCLSNSVSQVCGVELTVYTEREKRSPKPLIRFCDETRGIVLGHLLDILDNAHNLEHATKTSPGAADTLIKTNSHFWPLVTACNLNFASHDASGAYKRLIFASFREMVKYVQPKAIQWGAILHTPSGWTRGRDFANLEEAAGWFRQKQDESPPSVPSTPRKPKATLPSVPERGLPKNSRLEAEAAKASRSIAKWSDGVSEVSQPGARDEVRRRMEKIGMERSRMLEKVLGLDRQERELWMLIFPVIKQLMVEICLVLKVGRAYVVWRTTLIRPHSINGFGRAEKPEPYPRILFFEFSSRHGRRCVRLTWTQLGEQRALGDSRRQLPGSPSHRAHSRSLNDSLADRDRRAWTSDGARTPTTRQRPDCPPRSDLSRSLSTPSRPLSRPRTDRRRGLGPTPRCRTPSPERSPECSPEPPVNEPVVNELAYCHGLNLPVRLAPPPCQYHDIELCLHPGWTPSPGAVVHLVQDSATSSRAEIHTPPLVRTDYEPVDLWSAQQERETDVVPSRGTSSTLPQSTLDAKPPREMSPAALSRPNSRVTAFVLQYPNLVTAAAILAAFILLAPVMLTVIFSGHCAWVRTLTTEHTTRLSLFDPLSTLQTQYENALLPLIYPFWVDDPAPPEPGSIIAALEQEILEIEDGVAVWKGSGYTGFEIRPGDLTETGAGGLSISHRFDVCRSTLKSLQKDWRSLVKLIEALVAGNEEWPIRRSRYLVPKIDTIKQYLNTTISVMSSANTTLAEHVNHYRDMYMTGGKDTQVTMWHLSDKPRWWTSFIFGEHTVKVQYGVEVQTVTELLILSDRAKDAKGFFKADRGEEWRYYNFRPLRPSRQKQTDEK
ncbi:uncharacterized protein NECHADRAFT_89407 [Fusarium vanettenii 77-13-4]|uniref:Uncharacterized protein n=1 Tax=Fusarium vanettenii (strain ATCC MYA-4622 / CBS 123669 / FGSC 9596 / NRRL 45880 / 77-13-4) TaxID=660122 RepID=C7ZR22_FUSV7|nr:uncharacterized protein NECHADRAFT_89407 [Fusarium vanettenii 77-13-4]EEU33532.1 predicted protein [Fusarium vanettenii 77-13-4]